MHALCNLTRSSCVNGFSRFALWLNISNNNLARASHEYFKKAIEECGSPIKMREDKGSENRLIVKHLIFLRQNSIGGHIGGKLTRNARTERF